MTAPKTFATLAAEIAEEHRYLEACQEDVTCTKESLKNHIAYTTRMRADLDYYLNCVIRAEQKIVALTEEAKTLFNQAEQK